MKREIAQEIYKVNSYCAHKSANMLREAGAKADFVLCAIQRKDGATELLAKERLALILMCQWII